MPPTRGGVSFYNRITKSASITYNVDIYNVDSISNPQASSSASGIYFEFLFLRAHSRSLVDRMYWSGVNLNSFTTCSNDVTVGTTGPIGSGLPQFGFPRRFAISLSVPLRRLTSALHLTHNKKSATFILRHLCAKSKPGACFCQGDDPDFCPQLQLHQRC